MFHALCEVLATLPADTVCLAYISCYGDNHGIAFVQQQVYCGHEYTVKNLLFASHVEPSSEAVKTKLGWAKVFVSVIMHRETC